ncbi:MAG TPA: formyltetrahydrofolate deformylase [Actinomycetes bacterium]|nr:formyltetrahydrofolate deformylase [Actinomycetes bacterium]
MSSVPEPGHSEFILTLSCQDRPGVVYAVSSFLVQHHCTIISSQQYGDQETGLFFMRVRFSCFDGDELGTLQQDFARISASFDMSFSLRGSGERQRVLLMVSKFGHCLNDLLFRYRIGALPIEVVGVVSNHRDYQDLVDDYDIPFHHIPVTAATKAAAEEELLRLIDEQSVDLVVLARYMQVLSPELCRALEGRAINIHHSFLPSFKGGKPYHQAHERGVKLIGATAHYVTTDLDEGPIIEQEVTRVDHSLSADKLVAAGRDVECQALARAVLWHVESRILLNGHRTVVFR